MTNQNILAVRKSIVLKLVQEIIYTRPNYQEVKKEREQHVQYQVRKMLEKRSSKQSILAKQTQNIQQAVKKFAPANKQSNNSIYPQTSKQKEISFVSPKSQNSQDKNKQFNEMFIQRKSNSSFSKPSYQISNPTNLRSPNKTLTPSPQSTTQFQQKNISLNPTQSTGNPTRPNTPELKISSNRIQNRNPNSQNLPATIRDLRPTPTFTQLDLGKLNSLLKDPTLSVIICEGSNKSITVKRTGEGNRPTQVVLNEQEVQEIVQRFSQETKIPLSEGTFRTIVGSNLITANISSDNKVQSFTITKIVPRF